MNAIRIIIVVRLIRVIGFLRLYCFYIVIRVFKPRGYLSVIRVSSVNSVVMVIMII